MADSDETREDEGNHVARLTFLFTIVLAVLFVGSIAVFILR